MPVPATPRIEAPLIEVFSSLQGEGVLTGCRQIFVRFAACNLDCAYCDTAFRAGPAFRAETEPGSGRFTEQPNPADLDSVGADLRIWEQDRPGLHHSLCLTGGEPLLHAEVLERWLDSLGRIWPVYLETNGTLPDAFARIRSRVDYTSMDLKTEDLVGAPTDWESHAAFLEVARPTLCQVKLVVGARTDLQVLKQAAALVARLAPETPLILQPRTIGSRPEVSGRALLDLQAAAAGIHHDTRLIPQVHPLLGIA